MSTFCTTFYFIICWIVGGAQVRRIWLPFLHCNFVHMTIKPLNLESSAHFDPLTDLLSLSRNTEPLLSQRASLTGDRQNGEENVSESEPMVLSRLTSSDSSQEPSSPSSPAEGSGCWWEEGSAPASAPSVEVLLVMFLSSSSSSSWAAAWRGWGLEGMVGLKHY